MGDLLRDMMHERADMQGTPVLDLDQIVRAGDRRVKRRRVVAGAGVVAAVAAAAAIVLAVPAVVDDALDDGAPPVAETPTSRGGGFEMRTTTYAIGSSIYYGERGIDVSPYDVRAFVQTDDGFVVAASDGTVVLADGQTVEEIGRAVHTTLRPTLAADDTGSHVTWVEPSGDRREFVVYDTAARKEVAREADPDASASGRPAGFATPIVEALDDGVAYWHRSDGTVAHDIGSGETTMLQEGASPDWLKDVANSTLAFASHDDLAVVLSQDPQAVAPLVRTFAPNAGLSPDAGYLTTDREGKLTVLDANTGDDVTPSAGAGRAAVSQWVDEDSFIGYTSSARGDVVLRSMLSCTISSGECTVTAEDVGPMDLVQFPDGYGVFGFR